jgi:hypothetical protein
MTDTNRDYRLGSASMPDLEVSCLAAIGAMSAQRSSLLALRRRRCLFVCPFSRVSPASVLQPHSWLTDYLAHMGYWAQTICLVI